MTDTGNELSEILSRDMAPAASTGAESSTTTEAVTTTAETTERTRDEQGRFAQMAADQSAQQSGQEPQPTGDQQGHTVPLAVLLAEREKGKTAETANAELKRQMERLAGQVEMLSRQPPRQQSAQQQEQPKPRADIWNGPDEWLQQALSPLEESMQRQREGISRMMARSQHGAEKVDAAYRAMADLYNTDPAARFDYQRIMSSDHPYDELVKWHGRGQTLQRIGNDPDAWLKTEIDKMLSDPTKSGELLQRIQQNASQSSAQRSAPATALPPSISSVPGSGANAVVSADMSDEARFARALAPR